jgi:hypothetical protein
MEESMQSSRLFLVTLGALSLSGSRDGGLSPAGTGSGAARPEER